MANAEIIKAFRDAVDGSAYLARLMSKSGYRPAYSAVREIAKLVAKTYADNVGEPITREIITEIVKPLFNESFNVIEPYIGEIQTTINEGLGLRVGSTLPRRPNLDNLADDMLGKSAIDSERVASYAERYIDNSIRSQASFLSDNAGIKSYINRINEGYGLDHDKVVISPKGVTYKYGDEYVGRRICKFCKEREGRHEYPCDTKFFERHDGCHCEVDFEPFRGASKRVWGKETVYKGNKGKKK